MSTTEVTRTGQPRIESVDALRGFALIGVGLVHMIEQFAAGPHIEQISQVAAAGPLDQIIAGLNQMLLVGKFYLIFSLLFGLSFFIQIDALKRRGEPYYGRFAWRLTLLFAFGYVHHLFHRGDILMLYASLGLSLLLWQRLRTRYLIILALAMFLGLGRFLVFGLFADSLVLTPPDSPENLAYFGVLLNGSLWEVFAVNQATGLESLITFQFGIFGRGYVTLGLFLVGLVLGRAGFFRDLAAHRPVILKALQRAGISCAICAFLMIATFSQVKQPASLSTWLEAIGLTFYDLFNLSLATVFSCTFLLIALSNRWGGITRVFAPYGRMALTNYLLQALIGTGLFYGWGLAQLGKWPNRYLLAAGVAIALSQIMMSQVWMRHYCYGPCEWLWRSLTQRQWIPIRRTGHT